jgi:integrase
VHHIRLDRAAIVIRFSRSGSIIKSTKRRKPRVFSLSPQLTEALRVHVRGRGADEPLFLSGEGKRLHPDNFAKRVLKPIVDKLGSKEGFTRCATGWTEHTVQGAAGTSRSRRPHTTLQCTHLISEDDRRVSAQLGALMTCRKKQSAPVILDPIGLNKEKRQVVGLP